MVKVMVKRTKGGPGSGNYGHSGRPGSIGGSTSKGGSSGGGSASAGGSGGSSSDNVQGEDTRSQSRKIWQRNVKKSLLKYTDTMVTSKIDGTVEAKPIAPKRGLTTEAWVQHVKKTLGRSGMYADVQAMGDLVASIKPR